MRLSNQNLEKTRKGLGYMSYGYYVYLVMALLGGLLTYLWSEDPAEDPMAIFCFLGLVILIGLIFFLLGLSKIYEGSSYFSESHQTKVKIAIVLIIIGFILNQLTDLFQLPSTSVEALTSVLIKRGLIRFTSTLSYALVPVLLIKGISDRRTENYLYLGAVIMIVPYIILLVFNTLIFPDYNDVMDVALDNIKIASLALAISSVGYFLFARAFSRAEKRISEKQRDMDFSDDIIEENELKNNITLKICPNCGEKALKVYSDYSAYCRSCKKNFENYKKVEKSDKS